MYNDHSKLPQRNSYENEPLAIWLLLIAALLFRIIIAPIWIGYDGDVKTFMAWASRVVSLGLSGMYVPEVDYFLDYPPGYMYVLYVIGAIHELFHITWSSGMSLVIVKMPAMIADLLLSYMVYRMAVSRETFTNRQALGLATLVAFFPTFWFNSTVWGQVDSFFICFIVAYLYMQQKEKWWQAAALLAIAILIKPQGLLLLPFLLAAVLQQRNFRVLLTSISAGVATIVALVIPFMWKGNLGLMWLPDLYISTLSSYAYASLNAFNIMTLLGGNFIEMNQSLFIFSYSTWGWMLLIASLGYCIYLQVKGREQAGKIFYVAFLFLTMMFVLTTKMHERYLIYGLLPALVSFLYIRDRRILWVFIGFSATNFINTLYVLVKHYKQIYFIPLGDPLMNVISAANVALIVYAIWLGWKLFVHPEQARNVNIVKKSVKPQSDLKPQTLLAKMMQPQEVRSFKLWVKKDVIYVSIVVIVYSIIALFRLGGHEDPETYWKPKAVGEAVVVDFGKVVDINRINSFAGVGQGAYSYSFSVDEVNWEHSTKVDSNHAKVLTWHSAQVSEMARYVKITTDTVGMYVHEVGFFQAGSEEVIPIAGYQAIDISSASGQEISQLFDEQQTIPYAPSFMEGTYFDEIYHARTAYEYLHQIEPYENTHPPLGKVIISFGIWLFGLNPFGWRIMGTIFGILMIPVIYVFAKRLFGKSEYAFISGFLLCFEFMHFAQTRIATIDVYGVFFILLMFYFMYHYSTLNFYRESLMKTLIPLGLAGLTFGLGVASKWIVLYGGAGLAFILLIVLLDRYKEYRQALQIHRYHYEAGRTNYTAEESSLASKIVKVFPKYVTVTLLWCVLTFVLIPLAIYVASYIPFMQVPGPGHGLKEVYTYQGHMYNYHKNLVATHPFSSPWYSWPMIIRPIWYYQGQFVPEGMTSKIASLGNPLIWWVGFLLVLYSFYRVFKWKDRKLNILLIAYCSMYLPWILVPRLTFIYHYFAMVPFMILLITYYIKMYLEKFPDRKNQVIVYLAAVALLFVMFYPVLSGFEVPAAYTKLLRWLPGWNFF